MGDETSVKEREEEKKESEHIYLKCGQLKDTSDITNCICCCLWSILGVIVLLFCVPFL